MRFSKLKRQIKRGNFRLAAKEYEGAIEAFQKARDLLPDSVEILITLGKISMNLGRHDEGIRYFRDALSIEESDLTYSNLGIALTVTNKWEEAYEVLRNVKDPNTLTRYCLSVSSLYAGKHSQNPDLNLKQELQEIRFPGLALFYHKNGMHTRALNEFRKFGGSWKIYHSMGVENIYLGSQSSANSYFRQAYERYLEHVPEKNRDPLVLEKLEFDIILTLQDKETRVQELIQFAKDHPSFNAFYAVAAAEYEMNGYSKRFKEYLEKAVPLMRQNELDKDDIEYWLSQVEV